MKIVRVPLLLAVAAVCASAAQAQDNPSARRHPLEGVWSRVGGVADGQLVTNQPGYRMFIDGYYSWVWVGGMTPRTPAPASGATPAQIRDANRLTAQAGRNEITSMQTYMHRGDQVTLNPAGMNPDNFTIYSYRIVGDTLFSANILSQAGPAAAPQMGKYIRVGRRVSSPLEGAWRHLEGRNADGSLIARSPGYFLFVDGHFALVRVNSPDPRPALPPAGSGTVEQLNAVYGPFAAQHGTYEISGQTLTRRLLVTKNPAGMAGGSFFTETFRIRGDTLWVTAVANQDGPVANQNVGKYVRVRAITPPTQ
jgi:hypothetical protein